MRCCGKEPTIARLQDNLIYIMKGISAYNYHIMGFGEVEENVNEFLTKGLY